jgi:hypothetical protein
MIPQIPNASQMPILPGASKPFMTPWLDFGTPTMPDNHDMVMWWARYMWLSDGNYRTAMERVAAHFLTMIQFPDLEPDEENAWKEFYTQFLDYRSVLLNCAYDYLAYGNVFISVYLPSADI